VRSRDTKVRTYVIIIVITTENNRTRGKMTGSYRRSLYNNGTGDVRRFTCNLFSTVRNVYRMLRELTND